jgi:hypothetical protein
MEHYIIRNNGSEPFIAQVYPSIIEVYRQKCVIEYENQYDILDKKIIDTAYQEIFIGDNQLPDTRAAHKGLYPGNSILVHVTGHRYLFVGHEIYSFSLPDDIIQKYYSPVGNNVSPYPYAIGKHRTYFMLDRVSVPNELLDPDKDGYAQFYGFIVDAEQKRAVDRATLTFPSHTIAKRRD